MTSQPAPDTPLFSLSVSPDLTLHSTVSGFVLVIVFIFAILWILRSIYANRIGAAMEIDQAEIGIGTGNILLKPNWTDKQVAYSVWVELSTRKIGLEIDFEHDVISEVLDSWYSFFGITRDLLKTVPVQKIRSGSTKKIINLSIDVLNECLRPTLTKWQARYRRWYDKQLSEESTASMSPQEIQKRFPDWNQMTSEIETVNRRLIAYRRRLRDLVEQS